jgi:hypothetical protein
MIFPSCSDTHDVQKTLAREVVDGQPGIAQLDEEELAVRDEQSLLSRIDEPFKGDLTKIRKRKLIRVLVSYSKTNFFFSGHNPRGFEYELLYEYEKYLTRKTCCLYKSLYS